MKRCLDCKSLLDKQALSKDQWNTSRCVDCYRTRERNRRRVYRQNKTGQKRTCPTCGKPHTSPGYCNSYCLDCFRQSETARKAHWRENNREVDRARLKRYKARHNARVNRCRRNWKKQKMREFKAQIVSERGGGCVECGYNTNLAALTFHHLDPTQKTAKISELIDRKFFRNEEINNELDNCVLLCANCHAATHNPHMQADLFGL